MYICVNSKTITDISAGLNEIEDMTLLQTVELS